MKRTAVRLDVMAHPRSIAFAWWIITGLALYLLGHALAQSDWPYQTTRAEVVRLFWLVVLVLPILFGSIFGQQVYLDDQALTVRLGYLGLFSKRIPLSAIREIVAVSVESIADFSRKETGGKGRGMTCFYTQGQLGVEVIATQKRYFISCHDPATVVAAVQYRQVHP
ncbi:MAG: hypothetical protein H7338_03740 [Candidatus Sericytochromatia bacterium]|nr:hypothetical protein [Candidatus Sericytochromatia bacterium]